jgi:CRP-like cAMP-binding protein
VHQGAAPHPLPLRLRDGQELPEAESLEPVPIGQRLDLVQQVGGEPLLLRPQLGREGLAEVDGKLSPGMFVNLCGEVEALQGQHRLALLGPEPTFGESSLLGHRPSRATMRVPRKCLLLLLPLAALQEVTLTQPQVLKLVPANAEDR